MHVYENFENQNFVSYFFYQPILQLQLGVNNCLTV